MEIKFRFSNLYEMALKRDDKFPSLSYEKAETKIKMLDQFWATHEEEITEEFKRVTQLSFEKIPIYCYLNSVQSFSDPLTLKVYKNDEYTQDTLIHELCHIVMSQNKIGNTPQWKKLTDNFKNEPPITRVHIVVHAIHQLIYEKLFPERVESIQKIAKAPAYIRSWDIVKEIGPQKIVDTYLRG